MNVTHHPDRTPPRRSTEISSGELERLAHTLGLTVDLPDSEGGWARVTTPRGARYHAWLTAAEVVR